MQETNFKSISAIETECSNLNQATNALCLVIESLEESFGRDDENAALNFWTRRGLYLETLYLIYRDMTDSNERIRAEVEGNLIKPAASA